jgi:hypothetical protein
MARLRSPWIIAAVLAAGLSSSLMLSSVPSGAQARYTPDDVAQGKYLIEGVAMCRFCHGPQLGGIPTPADRPNQLASPAIAGLPMFARDEDAIAFFETGKMPDGSSARRPMVQFRFKHSDAVALVAYLRSLK